MNPRLRVLLLVATSGLLTVGVVLFVWKGGYGRFDRIGHVDVVTLPNGPMLLVSGARTVSPDSGPSYNEEGWVLLDPDTGKASGRTWFTSRYDFVEARSLLATGGARVAYMDDETGLHVRDLAAGLDRSGATLAATFPAIAAPWYQTRVHAPGVLAVEGDDRRWWTLDLATDVVSPGTESGQPGHVGRCHTPDRPEPDGRVRTFVSMETERHSDPNRWALVRGTRVSWDRVDDIEPLGLRLPYAWFLCDTATGLPASLPDGAALVGQWLAPGSTVAVSALDPAGVVRWTWDSELASHPNTDVEVRGWDDGFVLRVDGRIVRVGPDGGVLWDSTP